MPARRPYANRGVPVRPTTRRSGNAGSAVGFAALVAVLVVIGAGGVWLVSPLWPARPLAVPLVPGAANTGPASGAPAAAADSTGPVLRLAPGGAAAEVVPGVTTGDAVPTA